MMSEPRRSCRLPGDGEAGRRRQRKLAGRDSGPKLDTVTRRQRTAEGSSTVLIRYLTAGGARQFLVWLPNKKGVVLRWAHSPAPTIKELR